MSQYVETACKMFTAGGAVAQYLRVKTGTALAVAGATETELGTLETAACASGDIRAVRLRTAQGTCKMVAANAIDAQATVYGAAGGKIDDIANVNRIGISLEAATADGDVIEVLRGPLNAGTSYTTTPVAAAGSTVADAGQLPSTDVCHVTSDSATKGVKLPTGVQGMVVTIINNSATACELYAATGGTVNGAAANASVVITASLPVVCYCSAANTWTVFDTGAAAAAS